MALHVLNTNGSDVECSFFLVTADLWSADGRKEMNLVSHPSSADRFVPSHGSKSKRRSSALQSGQTSPVESHSGSTCSYPADGHVSDLSPRFFTLGIKRLSVSVLCDISCGFTPYTNVQSSRLSVHTSIRFSRLSSVEPLRAIPRFFSQLELRHSGTQRLSVTGSSIDERIGQDRSPFNFDERPWTIRSRLASCGCYAGIRRGNLQSLARRGPLLCREFVIPRLFWS
jgi:hypothetical protein